ncbi:MAG: class I SAM-dependent methyltransferase [candidate division WOR-3 bacterium]|nr:MAG: class I SAM-dependent methyltransferase [candidate division WOR-3 bacterium]
MKHWTEEFFLDKAELWLARMNAAWKLAPKTARSIVRILKKHGMPKGRILEVCCGNGRICLNLAKRGFHVTGVDISPLFIENAVRRARKAGVSARTKFTRGDLRNIERTVRGKYDAVLNIWTAIGYYDKKTDERFFKKVYSLLKKKGLFMIFNTMSMDFLSHYFMPRLYDETDKYLILHRNAIDRVHSRLDDTLIIYRKEGKDLKYVDTEKTIIRIYGINELIEMAENAGFRYVEAYDRLYPLTPARPDSHINIVFRK